MSAMPPAEMRQGALPSGTVTFVFTDIEGSTVRWERYTLEMETAVRRHDELMRSVFARQGGHVFKTVGDAFCVAFWRPEDAVAAILAAQRTLAAEDFSAVEGLRIRAAIHTGTADERDGDYFGPAVNRVARLLAIGHGGQVLVSHAAADLVQEALQPEASLRDLGEHRLRDLARPEHVYQLIAPDLASDFPPLRSLDVLPNNLPRLLSSFVGRETEIAELTALIEKHPLVTIVGSGGVGKTRLCLQVAANVLDAYHDGVWFIELAPLSSGDYIPLTVAQVLGITLTGTGQQLENLVASLRERRALLVFDNCEHLVEAASAAIAAILKSCPHVRILATGRQGLGLAGEATFRTPSLHVPSEANDSWLKVEEALEYAAISLFAERAHGADNRFALTDDNAPIIGEICRRLDGIPLAIELAASRLTMLGPRQLRDHLDQRFRVLTGGSRDALPRQQTLRATIDWSHELLDERERLLFRRLGIFVNGFALEGAVAIGIGEDLDELDAVDVLASLVDKSLVLAEIEADTLRYRLLESTRVYALEKIAQAGERDAVARRHLHYLRDRFAQLYTRVMRSGSVSDFTAALKTDLEDVRAALAGALARRDFVAGSELTVNIGRFWSFIGLDSEERMWNEAFLEALPEDEQLLHARLRQHLASNLLDDGQNVRGMELAEQSLSLARASGDLETLGWSLKESAAAAIELGRLDDAEAMLAEAGTIPDLPAFLRLRLLRLRAFLAEARGDDEAATALVGRVVEEARLRGDAVVKQRALRRLAEIEYRRGRTKRAVAMAREILPTLPQGGDTEERARWLRYLALFLVTDGDLREAAVAAREAARLFALQGPTTPNVTAAIEVVALVCALQGDLVRAATLAGYADVSFNRESLQRELFAGKETRERLVEVLRGRLAPGEVERLSAAGGALAPEAAVAFALEV